MEADTAPPYLTPYLRAAGRHGAGFESLLWASPRTQAARFEAIRGARDLAGQSVLDVGCGRADLLDYLLDRGVRPADYIGIEAVDALAATAERKAAGRPGGPPVTILRADFVRDPARLFVGADVVAISGSLNTMDPATFYATLRRAYDAAAGALVFNFLASPYLASTTWLVWHRPADVLRFARDLSPDVRVLDDYLEGDCTIAVGKPCP